MDIATFVALIILGYILVSAIIFIVWLFRIPKRRRTREQLYESHAEIERLKLRYSKIIDEDVEKERLEHECSTLRSNLSELRNVIGSANERVAELKGTITLLSAEAEFAEVGIRSLTFELDSHADYVAALRENQAQQKSLVQRKAAVICETTWTVGGKESEGRKMIDRGVRLSLRAFNNECDALMARINWRNLGTVQNAILKSADTIDNLNGSLNIEVTKEYIALKLREAQLRQEEALKKEQEREELRRQREEEREEAKAQRELDAEIRRREKEEQEKTLALVSARQALDTAEGREADTLRKRIEALELQLGEAQAARVRAQSMAEVTRAGYVYVISNGGSFGHDMFKVGMTRRLEPLDRVKELGDASVPFPFDVHALVYTEDAPRLERELHDALSDRRVNRINLRKEFFRADMSHVQQVLQEKFPGVPFDVAARSQEYAMTQALLTQAA